MGRSSTPTYVVELHESTPPGCVRSATTPSAWYVGPRFGRPGYGKPTDANLERYVMAYADSLKPGGANEHISRSLGYMPFPSRAIIRRNYPGAPPIASWRAAMFQVF